MSQISDLMAEYATNEQFENGAFATAERERLVAQAEALVHPQTTYMFTFTPDAKLAVIEAVVPREDAIYQTGETIRLFGWREGILHTIAEIGRYLATGQLKNHAERIRLNSKPKVMPDGSIYEACAACSYSPAADEAMWRAVIAELEKQLTAPPGGEVKAGAPETS